MRFFNLLQLTAVISAVGISALPVDPQVAAKRENLAELEKDSLGQIEKRESNVQLAKDSLGQIEKRENSGQLAKDGLGQIDKRERSAYDTSKLEKNSLGQIE